MDYHRLSMDYLCLWIRMDYLYIINGLSMASIVFYGVYGLPMDYLWIIYELSTDYLWISVGIIY